MQKRWNGTVLLKYPISMTAYFVITAHTSFCTFGTIVHIH